MKTESSTQSKIVGLTNQGFVEFQGHRNASVSGAMNPCLPIIQTRLGGDSMILPKKAENFTPLSMEEYDMESYLYTANGIANMEEEEELDPQDAAFMYGYLAA